jgi:hypothetical protein
MHTLFFLAFPLLLASLTSANGKPDESTTGAFTLTAHNKSFSAVNKKKLWVHPNGNVFLDAGKDNPPSSVELIAFLENTELMRIVQTVSGSAPGSVGNLDFGTWAKTYSPSNNEWKQTPLVPFVVQRNAATTLCSIFHRRPIYPNYPPARLRFTSPNPTPVSSLEITHRTRDSLGTLARSAPEAP